MKMVLPVISLAASVARLAQAMPTSSMPTNCPASASAPTSSNALAQP